MIKTRSILIKIIPLLFIFSVSFSILPNFALAQASETTGALKRETAGSLENAGATHAEAVQAANAVAPTESPNCGFFNPIGCVTTTLGWISLLVLKLVGLVTNLAGLLLNAVVKYTIVDMAKNYDALPTISTTWALVRDIANMCFIFVLLFAAIKTIIGAGKDSKGLIVKVVIAAVLMNFSLFFTKIIIDAANLLALTFYNAIAPGVASQGITSAGISNTLMQPLGLQSLWDASGKTINGTDLITIGVMGSILALIASFVFFAISLMFIIRYVILIIVLILSPIAVLSHIIPELSGRAKQWWDALLNQAFFAPAYMFMTWITIRIINTPGFTKTGNLSNVLRGTVDATNKVVITPSSFNMIMNFVIVIAFMIASLVIAKSISDKTGKGMGKLTGAALGFAGGATLGMAGRFGRGTVGRYAQSVADDKNLQARALQGDRGARLKLATAQRTAKSSFDIRGTAIGGSLEAGKARKGGFVADNKKREEDLKEAGKNVAKMTDEEKVRHAKDVATADVQKKTASDAHNTAITQATEEAQTAVTKSPELIEAEGAESRARARLNEKDISEFDKLERTREFNTAKAKTKKLLDEHQEAKKKFVEEKTTTEKKALDAATQKETELKETNPGTARINRIVAARNENIAKLKRRIWQPSTDKVLLFGRVKREDENAPSLIRAGAKQKSPEEEAVEALKKLNKEKDKGGDEDGNDKKG